MKSKTKSNDFSCNSSYYNRQWSCSWNDYKEQDKECNPTWADTLCPPKFIDQDKRTGTASLCLYQHYIIYAVLVLVLITKVIRVNTVLHEYFCNCTSIFIDLQDCQTRVEIHSAAKGHYTWQAVSKQLHKTAGSIATSYWRQSRLCRIQHRQPFHQRLCLQHNRVHMKKMHFECNSERVKELHF